MTVLTGGKSELLGQYSQLTAEKFVQNVLVPQALSNVPIGFAQASAIVEGDFFILVHIILILIPILLDTDRL
jgi:hypothetical protein